MKKYFIAPDRENGEAVDMDQMEKRQRGRPRSFHGPSDAATVQSLDRALRILAVVAAHDGLSLTEIAEASGIAASTAYRMGSAFLRRRKLVDRSRAIMQELMEKTGETANLGVSEDDCVVFVSQVETHQAIRAFFRPGSRSPFHASGIGKAILAHLPESRVSAIVRRAGLEAFTGNTLADIVGLGENLREVRARGWSVDDEERHPGMRCVAAAIFNEFAEPVGGISVSGPTVRVTVGMSA